MEEEVFKLGEFLTKSGRTSPYYLNFGSLNSGKALRILASFYIAEIKKRFLINESIIIFGPAYKGIPLATAITLGLGEEGLSATYCANRKEAKSRGSDAGNFLGMKLDERSKVIIVEDVITAGTTLLEVVPMIREVKAEILGAVIAVDREERSTIIGESALTTCSRELEIDISPITTITEIAQYLEEEPRSRIRDYLKSYGNSL
jgi:orotate phosphoribosyltransferase